MKDKILALFFVVLFLIFSGCIGGDNKDDSNDEYNEETLLGTWVLEDGYHWVFTEETVFWEYTQGKWYYAVENGSLHLSAFKGDLVNLSEGKAYVVWSYHFNDPTELVIEKGYNPDVILRRE